MGLFTLVGLAVIIVGIAASVISSKVQTTPIAVGVAVVMLDMSGCV